MRKIPYKQTNITLDKTRENRKFQIIDYVLTFFFFLFLIIITTFKIFADDDVFWHLATGRFIVDNGFVPSQDIFGFITTGFKWIPFEWGWDIITFLIYKAGGFFLLSVFRTLIIISIFLILISYLKRSNVSLTLIIIISSIIVIAIFPRFSIRPQIINYLFLAILIVVLLTIKKNKNKTNNYYYFIPLMFGIWANMHMGVILGLSVFFIYIITELINLFFISKNNQDISQKKNLFKVILIFFISVLFLLINPNFINTFIYAIKHTQLDMLQSINEWKSPFDSTQIIYYYNKIFLFFVVTGIIIIYTSIKKKDIFPALIFISISIYSLQSVRFIAEFFIIIFILWIVSINFILNKISNGSILKFIDRNVIFKSILIILFLFLIYNCLNNKFYKDYLGNYFRETGTEINDKFFPVQMFDFIKKEGIDKIGERPFNNLKIGGYFIWEFPGNKNFIDSRNLNDSIYSLYKNIDLKQPGFESNLKSIGIDYVIYSVPYISFNASEIERNIISYLSKNNDKWKLVYWDDKSFLFVKNELKFKEIIEKYEFKFLSPYNLVFNRTYLTNGYKEYGETVKNEIKRKIYEEPSGFFINDIVKFVNTIH